jgi:hypothetical protein
VDADAGQTVTSDTEEDGATPSDPVETSVTTPNGGTVSIVEGPADDGPPGGIEFLGQQVSIEAPSASAADPLIIVLRIDASLIPPGQNQNTVQVLKDGVLVPACTGAPGVADPDPCISNRALLADGDIEITVLTSEASVWTFGVFATVQGDVDCDGDVDSVDSLKGLRHVAGLSVSQNEPCPAIGSEVASLFGDVDCDDDVDSVDSLKILRSVAGLSVSQIEPCPDIGIAR